MVETIYGDMFSEEVTKPTAFINGVNCQGVMGAGVAVLFKNRWPAMFEDYRNACKSGILKPGGFHSWTEGNETVLNVASQNYFKDATVEWLESSLTKALDEAVELGIQEVRSPLVGGGLGGISPITAKIKIIEVLSKYPTLSSTLFLYGGAK